MNFQSPPKQRPTVVQERHMLANQLLESLKIQIHREVTASRPAGDVPSTPPTPQYNESHARGVI